MCFVVCLFSPKCVVGSPSSAKAFTRWAGAISIYNHVCQDDAGERLLSDLGSTMSGRKRKEHDEIKVISGFKKRN